MNRHILIVGNGSAEQAITGKLIESGRVGKVSVAPGNVPIAAADVNGLLEWAKANRPDLTVVGPLSPLAAGIVDAFQAEVLRIFGPTKAAAQIESSRVFAKQVMQRYNIPTAPFQVFDTFRQAMGYILLDGDRPLAIKADGVMKGKDLYLTDCAHDAERAVRALMIEKVAGDAGSRIIVEEMLEGKEQSFIAFTDGRNASPRWIAEKRPFASKEYNLDTLGVPAVMDVHIHGGTDDLPGQLCVNGLRKEGIPFVGLLTTRVKFSTAGTKVLSFNAHFSDLFAQAISQMVGWDLLYILEACLDRP